MNTLSIARYGAEVAYYTPKFRGEVAQLHLADHVTVTASDAGSAVFGAAIYDLSFADSRPPLKEGRAESRCLSGLSMMYMNVLDDAIDDPKLSLGPDQKDELIHGSIGMSWDTIAAGPVSTIPKTDYFKTAATLGSMLQDKISYRDTGNAYAASLAEFAEAEAAHGKDQTPEGLLASVINLGKPCGNIMSSVVQVVTGKSDPAVRRAAEGLGIYGMLLDHAFEVNADLRDNSPTIVTAILKRDGDTSQNRTMARELCLDSASDIREQGKQDLSPKQKRVYAALATLFDIRYKAIVRIKDSLIG